MSKKKRLTVFEKALIQGVNEGRIVAMEPRDGLRWTLTPEGHERAILDGGPEAAQIIYTIPS